MKAKTKKPMSRYNGMFSGIESIRGAFEHHDIYDKEIIGAVYDYEDYDGYAQVVFTRNGKLYEVYGSHCSCMGLEGQFQPIETTLEALRTAYKKNLDSNDSYRSDFKIAKVMSPLIEKWAKKRMKKKADTTLNNSENFVTEFSNFQEYVHAMAVDKGWWETERTDAEAIALMHSELSEALEAARTGYPVSDKIAPHGNFVEELADTIIRIMDLCGKRELDVAEAIVQKVMVNAKRPHKHGKKF